ncbi:MAG: endo-1,4-beta-xylanase [Prevotella sp.]|nr:endo-1,4-beta-xylanase [Prevotella sp.]
MKQNLLRQALRKAFTPSLLLTMGMMLPATKAHAQLSSNPDKFLGNITTRYQMDAGNGVDPYWKLWNQVTPENESKWQSVEGTRGSYNWGCDTPFNYAKQHGFTYKFHAFVWGAQYPNWLSSLSIKDRYASIVRWFDAIKKKYNTLPLIDVVNEAVGMHQQGNPMMKESLGGDGKTGYDWLIKAFEMAHERFPESILIYNDYNSFQHDVDNYITLVQTLRDYGAPIDAYGNQSHDVNNIAKNTLQTVMEKQQKALKMPMYITELDIDIADDTQQKNQYEKIFPLMWEAEYCAGVTIWGYIHGATWVDNSGIIKNGKDRPAMTWLRDYMATDAAKNAKSPYPGMKKEASIYIKPRDLKVAKGDVLPIMVRAKMATKTIEKIELYSGDNENSMELINTMTEEPYYTEYQVPTTTGWKQLRAVVTTTDGSTYERWGRFNVLASSVLRSPYNETVPELPGTIVVTEYDNGAQGVTYNKASRNATASMQTGGWMEYTVDVKEKGLYSFDAEVASAKNGATFHLSEYGFDNLTYFADMIEVPNTGSTSNFQTLHVVMKDTLTAGSHRICLNIDNGGFYMKNLTFNRYEQDKNITVSAPTLSVSSLGIGDKVTITVNATSSISEIDNVKVYANDMLIGTLTEAPYTMEWEPATKGTYSLSAIATDKEGKQNVSAKRTLKVNGKRIPYSNTPISIPGVIQAENFDKGGEGLSFHDSDSNREGDTQYRTDGEGVDFVKGNGGTCIGYTAVNEWLEYSVNVKEAGKYSYEATVSSGTTGSGFRIQLVNGNQTITLATVNVPQTGNSDWGTYTVVKGNLNRNLEAGDQIIRFTISGANCNIDKVEFKCVESAGVENITIDDAPGSKAIYNLAGQQVNGNYKGIVIKNGKKTLNK